MQRGSSALPPGLTRRRLVVMLLVALAAGAAVGAAVALFVAGDDDGAASAQAAGLTSVSELASRPARYYGRTVSTGGEVGEVLGARAFVLGRDELRGGDQLLVLSDRPVAVPGRPGPGRAVVERDLVQVVGELRVLDPNDVERELGIRPTEEVRRRAGRPVVIAEQIEVQPRLLELHAPVTVDRLLALPRVFEGRLVSVTATVTEREPDLELLVLDRRLLVLAGGTAADRLEPGDRARVLGTMRSLDPDQLPGRGRLDEKLFGELSRRPVLVAGAVEAARR